MAGGMRGAKFSLCHLCTVPEHHSNKKKSKNKRSTVSPRTCKQNFVYQKSNIHPTQNCKFEGPPPNINAHCTVRGRSAVSSTMQKSAPMGVSMSNFATLISRSLWMKARSLHEVVAMNTFLPCKDGKSTAPASRSFLDMYAFVTKP